MLRRSGNVRHFWYRDWLYTVVNASEVESVPGIYVEEPETSLGPRDMRKALWAGYRAPEMAYMLKRYSFETAFMARLKCHARELPIVKTEWGYVLADELRVAWAELEDTFAKITDLLLRSQHKNPEAEFPYGAYWPLPRETGYRMAHRTSRGARTAAFQARDACALLLARCSMAIALCTSGTGGTPSWTATLSTNGIPGSWIDILQDSVIADLSPGLRAGAFIDASEKTAWVNHVPCMVRANLSVYIYWGDDVVTVVKKYPFLDSGWTLCTVMYWSSWWMCVSSYPSLPMRVWIWLSSFLTPPIPFLPPPTLTALLEDSEV